MLSVANAPLRANSSIPLPLSRVCVCACLRACLPACLPAFLPAFLRVCVRVSDHKNKFTGAYLNKIPIQIGVPSSNRMVVGSLPKKVAM